MSEHNRPYWFPKLIDAAWVSRIRDDYPGGTRHKTDKEVIDAYSGGTKYQYPGVRLSDVRRAHEALADVYLAILNAAENAHAVLSKVHPNSTLGKIWAEVEKSRKTNGIRAMQCSSGYRAR